MSMNALAERNQDPAALTLQKEQYANWLMEIWSSNLGANDRQLLLKMNREHNLELDIHDLRRIKKSQEFAELQILAVETSLWSATSKIIGQIDDVVDSMLTLAQHGRSEIARVQAFRGLSEFMRDFAPLRNDGDRAGRNVNVVNVLFANQNTEPEDDVIEVDFVEAPEDFDEEEARKQYFDQL